ncbi:neuronal acetylcholine receptor subunit beta-3-like [Cloeon dipterum]|uniref:neuronal acetylcholine receptor subunit beta-3-like n=1 Tax=Cloeon dipterum TaxID=197152 RepID=UPI00321F77A1
MFGPVMSPWQLLCNFSFLLLCIHMCAVRGEKAETILRRRLFESYNKEDVPRKMSNDSVEILMHFDFKRIEPHPNFMISVTGSVFCVWRDHSLRYRELNAENLTSLPVTADEIWVPDISVFSVEATRKLLNPSAKCDVSDNGRVTCVCPFVIGIYCKMNFNEWPHDTQVCSVDFYTRHNSQLKITLLKNSVENVRRNPRWRFDNISTTSPVRDENSDWMNMGYQIVMKRKDMAHYQRFITPAMTIAAMALSVFWMPRDHCIVRIFVSSVVFLLNLQFLLDVGNELKGWSGDSVPKIVRFYRDGLYLNFTSVLVSSIICQVSSSKSDLPPYLTRFSSFVGSNSTSRTLLGVPPKAGPWHSIAALLDRVSLLIATYVYFWVMADLIPS